MSQVTPEELEQLRLRLSPLIGASFNVLKLPRTILGAFEPSQIGTIAGTLLDACIPEFHLLLPDDDLLKEIGLVKHEGLIGEREGYPDYRHESGKRLELKLLYVDPVGVVMKKPPTPREPSARLSQKVTVKNVVPETDVLMVVAYQLQPIREQPDLYSPTVIDMGFFSMIECIHARDHRLIDSGGKWFGDYETPAVLSKKGRKKIAAAIEPDYSAYGRKKSEGYDLNEDTNFGKLKRIPYKSLQEFLKKHGAKYTLRGDYPEPWVIASAGPDISENDADHEM